MKVKITVGLLLFLICFQTSFSQTFLMPKDTAVLTDKYDHVVLNGNYLSFLPDSLEKFDISDLQKINFILDSTFIHNPVSTNNYYLNNSCWYKYTVINKSNNTDWLIEFPDQTIDYLTLYAPDLNGNYRKYEAGSKLPYHYRFYKHKNFVFRLNSSNNSPITIYFRIKSDHYIYLASWLRPNKKFKSYAFSEYISLGIFYSFILIMTTLNLFLLILIKNKTYLFYIVYILSMGLYSLSQDGIGFQYLWPNIPGFDKLIEPVAIYLVVISVLIYAKYFLNTAKYVPVIDKLIWCYILFRTGVYISAQLYFPNFLYLYPLDALSLLLAYIAGITTYLKGNKSARFFVLGFSFLFIGFIVDNLEYLRIVTNGFWSVYSTNIGAMLEMTFLALAFADNLKIQKEKKEIAQQDTIRELRRSTIFKKIVIKKIEERNMIKDSLIKQLELKVSERSQQLNLANEKLKIQADELNKLNLRIDVENYSLKRIYRNLNKPGLRVI